MDGSLDLLLMEEFLDYEMVEYNDILPKAKAPESRFVGTVTGLSATFESADEMLHALELEALEEELTAESTKTEVSG